MIASPKKTRARGGIRSCIRMRIPPASQNEAIEILASVAARIQADTRCLSTGIYRCLDDAGTIMLEEFWQCPEGILQHLRSDDYRRILLVLEMAIEPPDIRFDTIAQSSGIEVIKKARIADES
ncbi:putative quinol monooxygenase [Desulfoferula mesophila]